MVEPEHVFRAAQHELGLKRIDRGVVRVREAHIDASRAELQRGAPGEQRGAGHASGAADDADAAVIAFMGVEPARRQRTFEHGRSDDAATGRDEPGCIQAERRDVQLAAMFRAIEREQAGFETDERDRVTCTHCAAEHTPGVRIESARHVEREHRRARAVHP